MDIEKRNIANADNAGWLLTKGMKLCEERTQQDWRSKLDSF